jgi:hypothetical protein
MKKSALFFLIQLFCISATFATIRTVSNSPTTTIAQFSTIQAAIDASSSGDTVLVHGSPIGYAGFTVNNKKLFVCGPGWSPDKITSLTAVVAASSITGASSSETEIHGLVFTGQLFLSTNKPDNIRIIRNRFAGTPSGLNLSQASTTYSNYRIEGNYFQDCLISGNTSSIYKNVIFENNLIYGLSYCCPNMNMRDFNNSSNSILFNHNLCYGPSSGSIDFFSNCGYLLITNNIFVRRNMATGNSNSVFNNNITFNAGNNSPWSVNGNQDGGGNISNQDPQMVDQALVNSGSAGPLSNFTISTGPANNSGIDGKDIGLLYDTTGSLNWTNSRNSRLPRIYNMVISNPTISSGGTLNITVEARKSN